MSAPNNLAVTDLTLRLKDRLLFGGISFVVLAGAPTTIMGPSGSGKSSLLSWLTGTLPPAFEAAGKATLNGVVFDHLAPEKRGLGILFQDDLLFPHLTVGENLAFAIPAKVRGKARMARVAAALAEAGLGGMAGRNPMTLSGGQRARAALLRALLCEPRALLLDEPFNKLDDALKDRFRGLVFASAAALGLPVLLVSHDPEDAAAAAGPVIDLAAP